MLCLNAGLSDQLSSDVAQPLLSQSCRWGANRGLWNR
ncbi:Protein of unknown function [Pyronema omphalodes CBS 100304]|uniref:Uncharacterized protein n=1 Tax=Pyronema omphalodes (strain CBS 100304) TaxID=1076935 RepID=U4L0J0_PYROM|nr:Protein of unknown function [Pyronema omphalodes CBS 100304]